jgi:hypothetical protein
MGNYLRILRRFGILIKDDNELVEGLDKIPYHRKGETFNQWKIRTFGENIQGLEIYAPYVPTPQTRMSTLERESGADYLIAAFQNYRIMAEEEAREAFEEGTQEIINRLTTVPRELLQNIVNEQAENLQDSARDFLIRYIEHNDPNINTSEILTDLIKTYSDVVAQFRHHFGEREQH